MNRGTLLTLLIAILPGFAPAAGPPATFCNPLNLDYGWAGKQHRHSADPVIVLFQNRYYLFATDDVPGYRVSDDLLTWKTILFTPDQRKLMSDNEIGTYCAPAVATDGKHLYFIRMSRRKGDATVPVMRSADPAANQWEQCGELRVTGDPCLFFDDGRAWLYHGLSKPTKVFEIDTKTWREIPNSEIQLRPALTDFKDAFGGYERGRRELVAEVDTGSWHDRFKTLPCQEAAWMTKRDGKYYLQYATPGTVTHWYCDTVMEGSSPTGPFKPVDYAPVSLKVGGFMGSAGHSCVFQDKYSNWWRVTTLWIGVHDLFERRIGLYPVRFDAAGRMRTDTALGDYPQLLPTGPRDEISTHLAGSWVKSNGKAAKASSSLTDHAPQLAADENCRTWWSAATANEGEWLALDLGAAIRTSSVQVNFAEQDASTAAARKSPVPLRYRAWKSADGILWEPLSRDPLRTPIGPHDLIVFDQPIEIRYLKIECVSMPGGGKFAIRDLRVFGPPAGAPPPAVPAPIVKRHADDDRNATIEWQPVPGADGYLVRFGDAPDRLWQTIQLQGGSHDRLSTHVLNRGVSAHFRIDAFNAHGMTNGGGITAAPVKVQPFDLNEVKLLPGPFHAAQERDKGYILRVEPERLMHWFRINNGLPSQAKPYGPWKPNDYAFQGHYEGHYLSACAQMYRSTGDECFKQHLDQTVAIMAEVQAAQPSGFLAPFPEKWLRIMAGLEPRPKDLGRLPVPWYALHKVYAGLIDSYNLAGNRQALEVMLKVADWVEKFSAQISDEAFQKMLDEEHGGINEAFANLHAITGNPAHLDLAKRFCHHRVMDPLARNEDILDGLHANTQVPKFTGFAHIFELTGDPQYRDAARNFWNIVVHERAYANGGNSNHEKFTPKAHLSLSLSKGNTETCNTFNMLKLSRHLFMWQPDSEIADYYERAQLNHILSSQHPQTGTVAYFHSMESGNRKGFSPSWVSFACCHGSGMENHAKYGDSIYFHQGAERLFVNLFIASELNWQDAGIIVKQTTAFPEEEATTLTITTATPMKATLSIRKPCWAGPGFAVSVNGQPAPATTGAEGYVDLARTWQTGDTITVTLPMSFRWEGFKDDPDRAALLYGPALLVAKTDAGCRHAVALKPADKALAAIHPTDKPLHFTGDPAIFQRDLTPKPVHFLPLYQEYQDPYIAYWDLRDKARLAVDRAAYQAEANRWTTLAPRTVDMVFYDAGTPSAASTLPGRLATDPALPRTAGADRTEQQHELEAHNGYNHEFNELRRVIAGSWQTFRTAELGSDRFGWTLMVAPAIKQSLLVRLWSPPEQDPDARRATACGLEVRVAATKAETTHTNPQQPETTTEGNQLATDQQAKTLPPTTTLGIIGPAAADGSFREVSFPIPASLIADKDRLIVRIVRQGGKTAGLVSEVRILCE
jgi:DUF1680 family protein